MLCKKCILPESRPHIWLNSDGICNLCVDYEKETYTPNTTKPLETDFIKLLNKHKGKGKYDCLVMCSGGKDSTASLYYMVKRYKLNTLAFTFDHGFESEEALDNITNAVHTLGVDFLYFKSDYMLNAFKKILHTRSKASICHICSIWYMQLTFDTAMRYNIPIIIAGWTKGQSTSQNVMTKCSCNISAPEYAAMGKETMSFIDDQLRRDNHYKDFPKNMETVLMNASEKHRCVVLSPHWFLPFEKEAYIEVITRELGWKAPKLSYPKNTTNCLLNFISVHNAMQYYGYTHYHIEASKLIRQGLLTREEALRELEICFDKGLLDSIGKKLDYSFT